MPDLIFAAVDVRRTHGGFCVLCIIPLNIFFTFFIMLFNVCFHFHTFKKLINPLFVFTSKRAAGIASDPHKFIPLEEPTAQQWRPFTLTNSAPPNVAARSYVRPLFCATHGKAAGRSRRLASPCRHRSIFDDIRADACRPASPIPRLSFAASASCLACLVQNRRLSRDILQRYASAVTAPE